MYALTVGKAGAKVTRHDAASGGDPWIDQAWAKFFQMTATMAPVDYFAYRLSQFMDLPVVKLTGLEGGYDFKLEFTREQPPGFPQGGKINGGEPEPDMSGPTIFAALKHQPGLELKAQRGPVEVIVIEHAEKPTEN